MNNILRLLSFIGLFNPNRRRLSMQPFYAIFSLMLLILVVASCKDDDAPNMEDPVEEEPTPEMEVSLPRINISLDTTDLANLSKEDYVDAHIEIEEWEGSEALVIDMEIRGRGNSTWGYPKKPFQIRFEDKEEVLGMPRDRKWILLANYTDKSMLRNQLGLALGEWSELDWNPKHRFVDLYLNDEFNGTYQISQKVEESSNRVNIGEDGFLLELDVMERLNPGDVYVTSDAYLYNIKEPSVAFNSAEYDYIQNYVREMERAIWSENFLDPEEGYRKYLDIDSVVDYYLVNEIARNTDARFVTSVFMHMKLGDKMKMGPLWDFDLAFGNVDYNDNFMTEGFYMKEGGWMPRFFEDPKFVAKVKERFLDYYAAKDDLINLLQDRAAELDDSQKRNYEKWETLGRYVWPNYVYFDTYEEEVDYLVEWVDDRFEWLHGAFEAL